MKFYFSGVKGKREVDMLKDAGVSRILVDQFDYDKIVPLWNHEIILDSGSYRVFKSGKELDVKAYCVKAKEQLELGRIAHAVAPDVIADGERSFWNWIIAWIIFEVKTIPVWQYGTDPRRIIHFLNLHDLVGIGGVSKLMRSKNKDMLDEIAALCETNPGRFHVFGCNWSKAIERLNDTAASADSSVWLRGVKYKHAIFKHRRNGHLYDVKASLIPLYDGWDGRTLSINNAREIAIFTKGR